MHVLILNHHPIHTEFLQKGLRYQNIGADACRPENILKLWYGQYDALIIPLKSWDRPPFPKLLESIQKLGNIPTLITTKFPPPDTLQTCFSERKHLQFINSRLPFHRLTESLKSMIQKPLSTTNGSPRLKVGDLHADIETRHVEREQQPLYLRNKEFSLLESLMRNAGKVLTRTFLLENAWDRNTNVLSNTVDVHINRLRKKVDVGFTYSMIQTIPCIGYKILSEHEIQYIKKHKTKI